MSTQKFAIGTRVTAFGDTGTVKSCDGDMYEIQMDYGESLWVLESDIKTAVQPVNAN